MAFPRHVRAEKRTPSFCFTITGATFIAFLLIAVWMISSPSEAPNEGQIDSKVKAESLKPGSGLEPEIKEDSVENDPGDSGFEVDPEEKSTEGSHVEKFQETTEEIAKENKDEEEKGNTEEEEKGATELEQIKGEEEKGNTEEEEKGATEIEQISTKEKGEEQPTELQQNLVDDNPVSDPEVVSPATEAELLTETKEAPDAEVLPSAEQAELSTENKESPGTLITQAAESKEEEEQVKVEESSGSPTTENEKNPLELKDSKYNWKLCTLTGAADFIPCLDNVNAIKHLKSTKHYEHRERHCPEEDDLRSCLVPLPDGYKQSIPWPRSRNEVWYNNVPHLGLVSYKADQKWVQRRGDLLVFPGGGTQFKEGALHYINWVEKVFPDIKWGKHTRVLLDVGCGVASFGGYLFDKNVLALSFAPKDEHEAQVQFALERGIPAISAVMGTTRQPYPSNAFDVVHCARCRVPWQLEGGKLLLELNRVLRPGGYFVWSATPVYRKEAEDIQIWKDTIKVTKGMCWKLVAKAMDQEVGIGVAVFQKPTDNSCYEQRQKDFPPLCEDNDKADAAWYIPMNACIHKIPSDEGLRGAEWPQDWPARVGEMPAWLSSVEKGIYGKPATEEFPLDTKHWRRVVRKSYEKGLGIDWSRVRNIMDMKATYGGFAAALADRPVWVMNVVPITAPDTLPIIFDRGLIGIYHDWCESFSTYPRTYDLLHADHLFSHLKQRCNITYPLVEMDRILRPLGWVIFRDTANVLGEVREVLESLHWDVDLKYSQNNEQLLVTQKKSWRPEDTTE